MMRSAWIRKRISFGAISLIALFSLGQIANAQIANAQNAKAKKIDELVAPLAKTGHFSGVVIASENGKVIYEKAFGLANADFKIPNALNTRIGIASITKPMTSVILLKLIEENKIKLEDPLAKYIPDFPSGDKITVDMLYRHRSGILHRVMPPEMETVPYTSAEMVEKVKQSKLAFTPGERRLYSSGGYAVLAHVLEIVSGRPYAELLETYVFAPAGMKDSVDFDGRAIMERSAEDYMLDDKGYRNAALKDYSFLVGAGSVFGTAADLHRFASAIVDGKYGNVVKTTQLSEGIFSSSGGTNGHRAYVEMKQDKSYGYAYVSNLACGSVDIVQAGIKEIMEGREPKATSFSVPKFDPAANPDLNRFTGKFKATNGTEIEIVNRGGSLYSSELRLYSVKPNCFFDFRFFGEACFEVDGSTAKGIRWRGATFDLQFARQ